MQQFKASTWRIHDIIIEPNEVYTLDFTQTNPNMFMLQNPNPSPVRIGITRIPTANKYEFSVGANTSDTFGRPIGTGRLFLYNPSSANTLSITVYSNEMNFDMSVLKGINVELGNVNVESSNVIGGFGAGVKLPSGDNHIGRVSLNVDVEEAIQSIKSNSDDSILKLKQSNNYLASISEKVGDISFLSSINENVGAMKELITEENEKGDIPALLYDVVEGSHHEIAKEHPSGKVELTNMADNMYYLFNELDVKIRISLFNKDGTSIIESDPIALIYNAEEDKYSLFSYTQTGLNNYVTTGGGRIPKNAVIALNGVYYVKATYLQEAFGTMQSVGNYVLGKHIYIANTVEYKYPTGLLINESTAFPVSVDIEQLMWLDMDNMTEYEISKPYLCDCIEEIYVKGTGGLYKVIVTDILDRQHIYCVRPDKPLKKVVKTIKGIKITTTSTSKGTIIQCKLSKMFD